MKIIFPRKKEKYDFISISHYFYPRIGGLENVAYNLVKGLNEKGLRCLSIHGAGERYSTTMEGFSVETFKTLNIFNKTYPLFGLRYVFFLNKILAKNPNAQVLIHSRHLTSSLLASAICILRGHPYYVLEHNAGPVYFEDKTISDFANWIDKYIFRFVLKKASNVISVSEAGKKWVSRNFKIKRKYIDVIYNSYNEKEISNRFTEKQNLVVWAAKWIPVKDPNTVLRAFKRIADKYPDWKFFIIGEGPELKYKGQKLSNNIEIVPEFLKQEDLFRLLKRSKIYINTSLSEGLPVGVLEACAFGNIPILSSAPSNKEIASLLKTRGFIFERRDSKDLSEDIKKAILKSNDIDYLKEISKKTKTLFSNGQMINKYYEYLFPSHYAGENLHTLSIVIPAYNEEKTLKKILIRLIKVNLPKDIQKEIIIVNDGSADKTLEIAKAFSVANKDYAKFLIINNEKNLGKSQSVKKGVLQSTGGLIVVQDADLEYRPKDLVRFVRLFLKRPETDVIYGNRFNKKNKFINPIHYIGNRGLTMFSNIFTRLNGFAPKDMETCYKMARGNLFREIFSDLKSKSHFGLEPEITARFARYRKKDNRKLNLKQIDIRYNPRLKEQGKKMKWFKYGIEAIGEVVKFNIGK